MTYYTLHANPAMLDRVDRKAATICDRWQIHNDVRWQVWVMVATIEVGAPTKLKYHNNGINFEGWGIDGNPRNAYQGFYRMDQCQRIGQALHTMYALRKYQNDPYPTDYKDLLYFDSGVLVWEPVEHVAGYHIYGFYYSESEARSVLALCADWAGYKRGTVSQPGITGRWRVQVETTRKPKSELAEGGVSRQRIPA